MTNTANHSPRNTNDQEVTMYQLPGHTLVRVEFDAEWLIEGDHLLAVWGPNDETVCPVPVEGCTMETPFIACIEFVDGTACRRFAGLNSSVRVAALRNVPLTD
jgi:hypothetical protein